jgi:hypothetical protein
MPDAGTVVAAMIPVPTAERLAPLPKTNEPVVLVPGVSEAQAEEPLPVPQGAPASITLPAASHFAQLPEAPATVALTVLLPVPVNESGDWKLRDETALLMAVRTDFSEATFVSSPGVPTVVTSDPLAPVPNVGVPLRAV